MKRLSVTFVFFSCAAVVFSQPDTVAIRQLVRQAANTWRDQPDSAVLLDTKAIALADKLLPSASLALREKLLRMKIDALDVLSTVHHEHGRMVQALGCYNQMKDLLEQVRDTIGLAGVLYGLGEAYNIQGNIPKTIECYSEALKIYEKKNRKHDIALQLYCLGRTYSTQGDSLKRDEYFARSLRLFEEINDGWGIPLVKRSLAGIAVKKGQYDKALEIFRECLRRYRGSSLKGGDRWGIANSLESIGQVHEKRNANDSALYYFSQALKIREEMGYRQGITLALKELAQLSYKMGNKAKAEEFAGRALKVAREVGAPSDISQAAKELKTIYKEKGDYKNAFDMLELYTAMRDSVQNEENRKAVYRQQVNYEFEKKQAEVKAEQDKKEALVKQQDELRSYREFVTEIICIVIFVFLIIIALILYRRYRAKKRTSEELAVKNAIIAEKNKDITDSINYARRIQTATLPSADLHKKLFPDSFIFFRPRDIVSGDFYWFTEKGGKKILAAVDCTGHGVPGALMSMIGTAFLNEIVNQRGITEPGNILSELRHLVIHSLKQTGTEGETRDGMDIAIVSITGNGSSSATVEFAGANNPLWIVRHQADHRFEMMEVEGDKRPVGYFKGKGLPFTNHAIEVKKGEALYIFTDGYADQFGGEKGKKFKYKQLQQALLSIHYKPMEEQGRMMEEEFNAWKRSLEQVDDVLLMGVRI